MEHHNVFKTGNICRIYIKDFLTFDEIEVRPKPHLNFIMGPNGTGKSTILCAICICLGGKPSVTGRGKEVTDYIKNGKDTSVLETEIFVEGNESNVVIKRQFDRTKKSIWFLQGREVSKKTVETKIESLNIQVDNLCQFLPQDRVANFAKMNSLQLLEATEKAVGDASLFEQHELLCSSGDKLKDLNVKVKELESQLDIAVKKNESLKDAVMNHERKNKLEEQIKSLYTQRLWFLFDRKRRIHKELKSNVGKLKITLDAKQKELNPARKKIEDYKRQVGNCKKSMKAKSDSVKKKQKVMEQHQLEYQQLEEELQDIQRAYDTKWESEKRREKELADLHKQLDMFMGQLQNMPQDDDAEVQRRQNELTQEIRKESRNLGNIQSQEYEFKQSREEHASKIKYSQNELRNLQDVRSQRLELLGKTNEDAARAARWLENNREKFSAAIYPPMCTQLNIKEPKYAKYVEDRVSTQDLVAFVCESKEDMNLFKDHMDRQKLRVNVVFSRPRDISEFRPTIPIERLRELGFINYMLDIVDAPSAILAFLCQNYGLHRIPFAEKADFSQVPGQLPQFYIGGEKFSKSQSRYDKEWSTSVTSVRNARLLHITEDSQRIHQLMEYIKQEQDLLTCTEQKLKQCKAEEKELEKNLERWRNEKKQLQQRLDARMQMNCRIGTIKKQIARKEESSVNLVAEKQKMKDEIEKKVDKMVGIFVEEKVSIEAMGDIAAEYFKLKIQAAALRSATQVLEDELVSAEQAQVTLQEKIEKMTRDLEVAKTEASNTLEDLLKSLGVTSVDQISPAVREKFKDSNLEETEQELHQLEAHRDCLTTANESEVREYKEREKEVKDLQRRLESAKTKASDHHKRLEDSRTSWLPRIRDLTENISNSFSQFMARLGCFGEVLLDVGEEDDFRKYGIIIKVCFRDGDRLRELTAQHQSGGERAVSTALYLLALQSLTSVPFRCVDEINQGMDPINERRMLTMLMKTVAAEKSSQYFFVTPKLLPDMEYNEFVNIMVVFNSQTMLPHRKFHLRKILKRRMELNEKENIASC